MLEDMYFISLMRYTFISTELNAHKRTNVNTRTVTSKVLVIFFFLSELGFA